MFNKDNVGSIVISKYWGIGTIVKFGVDIPYDRFPVECEFHDYSLHAYFKSNGECCLEDGDKDKDITLYNASLDIEEWDNPTKYATGGLLVTPDRMTAEEWSAKYKPDMSKAVLPQVIDNGKIVELSPEILAEVFWGLDSSEQARFYNHLDTIADYKFPFQLQSITDEDGLTLAGRRVMQHIGEYSHWGLVPKIREVK